MRIHKFIGPLFLTLCCLATPIYSADSKTPDSNWDWFYKSENRALEQDALSKAFLPEMEEKISALRALNTLEELKAWYSESSRELNEPARQRAFVVLVEKFTALGNPEVIPILEEIRDTAPTFTIPVIACRHTIDEPVFDYRAKAAQAIWNLQIAQWQTELKEISSLDEKLAWFQGKEDEVYGNSPRFVVIQEYLRNAPASEKLFFRQEISHLKGFGELETSLLLMETWIGADDLMDRESFAALNGYAARRYLEYLADTISADRINDLVSLGQAHPETATFAKSLLEPLPSVRAVLEAQNVTGAVLLARDSSPFMTDELELIAGNPNENFEVRRLALMSLRLQQTWDSSQAIERLKMSGDLSEELRKVIAAGESN